MLSQLISTDDEHHWVLLDHAVAQLAIERRAFRLQTWSLDGSIELRVGAPCVLVVGSGTRRELVPTAPETLAPLLALVGATVRSLTVTREPRLVVEFADESVLELVGAGTDAWTVQGGGVLEGMAYRSPERGLAPWD